VQAGGSQLVKGSHIVFLSAAPVARLYRWIGSYTERTLKRVVRLRIAFQVCLSGAIPCGKINGDHRPGIKISLNLIAAQAA
jgi:hypothetical protein